MKNNKIACVVVWYNPNSQSLKNIQEYSDCFKKIYIVDNSETSNIELAKQINNSIYIPNFSNLGIAAALNIGCNFAYSDSYEWCITMDQDSSWNLNQLTLFLEKSNLLNKNNNKIVSFSPQHSNEVKSTIGQFYSNYKISSNDTIILRNKVMTSGNLINLYVWKQIGMFNESLFIDEVDHEFCYRLIDLGYKICEIQDIYMIHTLGNIKKTFFPRACKHSGVRLFYIFRNMLYIKKMFPYFYKIEKYRKYMISAIIQKSLEFRVSDLKFIHQGIKAFKQNKFGVYSY